MKVTDQTPQGVKFDGGKARFDLIPVGPLRSLAEVYTMGAAKYADNNWRKGILYSRIYAAVQRHLAAFWEGEDLDQESGLPHLAHAAWGLFTMLEYAKTHKEQDDRYVTETRNDVLSSDPQAAAQDPVQGENEQLLRGWNPRRVVLGHGSRSMGGVQMDSIAQAINNKDQVWFVSTPSQVDEGPAR